MQLELTVDIPDSWRARQQPVDQAVVETFVSQFLAWLPTKGRLVGWRVIEKPDPNEEHSG